MEENLWVIVIIIIMWGRAAKGATVSLREQEECWLVNGVRQHLLGFIKHNSRSGIKGTL